MPPVGFEPTISAGERPQTYALDGAATGIGDSDIILPEDTRQCVYFKWLIDEKYRCQLL
jgi:hypothetical protein